MQARAQEARKIHGMREYMTALLIGVVVILLLMWVAFGRGIIERFRGESTTSQPIELVVHVTAADTEAPIPDARVTLGSLESRTPALDQFALVGRRVTDRMGVARFEVSLHQDEALLIVSAPRYGEHRVAAPDLWTRASYTEAGYQIDIVLSAKAAATPDR